MQRVFVADLDPPARTGGSDGTMVCPYSSTSPAGCRTTCVTSPRHFLALGHDVSVLAPTEDDADVAGVRRPRRPRGPGALQRVGRPGELRPGVAPRVRRWLREGEFDVMHLHEPATPSVSLLACWAAEGPWWPPSTPANLRSRAMSASASILCPSLEKISARIAVSEDARAPWCSTSAGSRWSSRTGCRRPVRRRAGPGGLEGLRLDAGLVGRIDEPRAARPCSSTPSPGSLRPRPGCGAARRRRR